MQCTQVHLEIHVELLGTTERCLIKECRAFCMALLPAALQRSSRDPNGRGGALTPSSYPTVILALGHAGLAVAAAPYASRYLTMQCHQP